MPYVAILPIDQDGSVNVRNFFGRKTKHADFCFNPFKITYTTIPEICFLSKSAAKLIINKNELKNEITVFSTMKVFTFEKNSKDKKAS